MIKNKKQMLIVIGAFCLVLLLGTATYAFFNYTRTGGNNTIQVGRIYFNSEEGQAINLTNLFPIDTTVQGIMNDATKVGTLTIDVTGDTTYDDGIEYLVTATNVTNTVNDKHLPISIAITTSGLGTEDEEYFDHRGSTAASSLYRVLAGDTIENNGQLLVGYIKSGQTGIDGSITIKAYIDEANVAITDTYPAATIREVKTTGYSSSNCETVLTGVTNASTYCASAASLQDAIDNEDLTGAQITLLINAGIVSEYTNGTSSEWVGTREVFTTSEWNSLQSSGISFKIKVEANEGKWVDEVKTVNAMVSAFPQVILSENQNIKEIYFNKMGATRMQAAYDAATIKADMTYNGEGKVLAWLEENPTVSTKYNLIVASDGDTYLTTGQNLFNGWAANVEKIEFNNVNTSRVSNMSSMFGSCGKVESLDLSSFDTSNVQSMEQMFYNTGSLSQLNTSSFNTASVTTMNSMFNNTGLTSLNLSHFDTSSLTNMNSMFFGSSVVTLNLDNWDLTGLSASGVFAGSSLKNLSCKNWVLPATFSYWIATNWSASNIETIDVTGWNLSNTTDISGLFSYASHLSNVIGLNTWDTSNIQNMSNMFTNDTALTSLDLSSFNLSSVTNSSQMFKGSSNLATIYASNTWNASSVTTSTEMFTGCTSLVGTAPSKTYSYDSSKVDKNMAKIATDSTEGYLTDISRKPTE